MCFMTSFYLFPFFGLRLRMAPLLLAGLLR
jgi:hypothetical protein